MEPINYITDHKGNKLSLILNDTNEIERAILEFWLNEPDEIKSVIDKYFAQILIELNKDKNTKKIEDILNVQNDEVHYDNEGRKLNVKEYSEYILKLSDEAHKGENIVEHSVVEDRIAQYIKRKNK